MKKIILLFAVLSLGFGISVQGATYQGEFEKLLAKNKLPRDGQASCISDTQGEAFAFNKDVRIIPASVSKIYTTDFALAKLSADFRYSTSFYAKGDRLYINGGGDPHFVVEHLSKVLQELKKDNPGMSIRQVTISPTFYFNWKQTQSDIGLALREASRSDTSLPFAKDFEIAFSQTPYRGRGSAYEFKSAPLPALLKQMNNYSTNISADTFFNNLGGTFAFSKYMQDTYGVDEHTIRFETGSGLHGNYTTCALTLRVLEHLKKSTESKGLSVTDILTVPKIDSGVLQKRTISAEDGSALVAKSGYLNYYHTLAGIVNTKDGPAYFAIFTYFPNLRQGDAVKRMIDDFVIVIVNRYRARILPFAYTPDTTLLEKIKIVRK